MFLQQYLVEPEPPKPPFSPPNSNFHISSANKHNQFSDIKSIFELEKEEKISKNKKIIQSDEEKLDNLYAKISVCGQKSTEFVSSIDNRFFEVPIYCNNRSCNNEGCKTHRGYLFNKNHSSQIIQLDKNIRKPKGWVFTGWKVPLNHIDREFLQQKLRYLNQLCSTFSVSAFSIHMEVKIYKDSFMGYIHFHVVSGGFRQIRILIKKWGRVVKHQDAIKRNNLNYYVSKYASKTPKFNSKYQREVYHLLVYKLQMHRFSIKKDNSLSNRKSEYVNVDLLISEVKRSLFRNSYLNPISRARGGNKENQYYAILEPPPPINEKQQKLEVFIKNV